VGVAVVDHNGQVGLTRQADLGPKGFFLHVTRGKIPVVIEAHLAYRNHPWVAGQRLKLSERCRIQGGASWGCMPTAANTSG